MTAAIENPNYQDPFGNTLLHSAVVSGDLREVRRLLAAGADPLIPNREGRTALQAAAILGHERLYRVLALPSDAHVERLLDEALKDTFPASDPVAITLPSPSSDEHDRHHQQDADSVDPVILGVHRR